MSTKATYTKIDEKSFKIEQDVHHEDTLTILEQFQELQIWLINMKNLIKDAKDIQNKFINAAKMFNLRVWMLDEAKKECWFDYKIPDQVVIPKWFNILWTNPENLPVIEFDWPKKEGKSE